MNSSDVIVIAIVLVCIAGLVLVQRWRASRQATKEKPVITWSIPVYDKTAEKRVSLKRKLYRFNYDRATDDEAVQVLRLVSKEAHGDTLPKPKIGETLMTFQFSGGNVSTNREILQYRHLFEYTPDKSCVFSEEEVPTSFLSVALPPDSYFEDNNEKPITLMQMRDREARMELGENAFAVIYDQPESILRLGPVKPIRPEFWRAADAELVSHFFDVYRYLLNSRWLRSRYVVMSSKKGTYQTILPVDKEYYRAVIIPFRKLYSKNKMDDMFNRCCKIHNRHCPKDHPIYDWVNNYRTQFNALLEQPVSPPLDDCTLSARRYLDAFAYGAQEIHASSKNTAPAKDLENLLASHPKEMVVVGYYATLSFILSNVSMVIPVLKQSVDHWINDLGWAKGNKIGAQELFG